MKDIIGCAISLILLTFVVFIHDVFGNSKVGDKLEFDLYKPKTFKSSLVTDYQEVSGLHPWYELAISFINTVQPEPLPYEIAVKMKLNPNYDFKPQAISFELPAVIVLVIGILFVLILPIVGICFCSCRNAKKCGGKMVQKQRPSDKRRRQAITVCLAIIIFFIFLGVVMALVCSANMGNTFINVELIVKGIVEEILGFILNILSNLQAIIVNLFLFIHALVLAEMSDQTIREGFGQPLQDSLMPAIVPSLDELVKLSEDVTTLHKTLTEISDQVEILEEKSSSLKPGLETLSQEMTSFKLSCSGLPDDVCKNLNPNEILIGGDYSNLPSLNYQEKTLQEIVDLNFGSAAADAKKVFEDLPETIVSKTKSVREDVIQSMNKGKRYLIDIMDEIYYKVHKGLLDLINEYMPMADVYFEQYLRPYNKLRALGMAGPGLLILIIVALLLCGMICGIFGYKEGISPTTRSTLSHRGGNLLMAASGFCFIFSWLLMLLTAVLFMTGFHLQKVCEPLQAGDLYADVVDNPAMWEGKYFLGDALYKNGRIPLKLSSILDQCRDDWASYSVFMVERIYNVTEKLNITQIMGDIDKVLDGLKVDISDQVLVTGLLKDIFSKLLQVGLETIPYSTFINQINKGPIRGNTVKIIMDLTDVNYRLRVKEKEYRTNGNVQEADKAKLLAEQGEIMVDKVQALNSQISAFGDEITKLGGFVSRLQAKGGNFKTRTEEVFTKLGDAEKYLQGEGFNDLVEIAKTFKDRILGYVDQFLAHVLMLFQKHLLKCSFVSNIHDALLILVCQDLVYPLNGYWLALGLSVVCIIPCIIFSVKLAKFYRRMDFEFGYEPTSQDDTSSLNMYTVSTPSGLVKNKGNELPTNV